MDVVHGFLLNAVNTNRRSANRFPGLHCVYASGSLISSILPSLKRITQVYLHFGQNRGKSSSTVCERICVLVLPPHLGQQSQSDFVCGFSVIYTTPRRIRQMASYCVLPRGQYRAPVRLLQLRIDDRFIVFHRIIGDDACIPVRKQKTVKKTCFVCAMPIPSAPCIAERTGVSASASISSSSVLPLK